MYFSIIFCVQEVLKLIYCLSASGCLIIEEVKCLSSKGCLARSFFAVNIVFVYTCDHCQIAHGTVPQVYKLWDHIGTAHINLSLNVLGENFSFCKTNIIKPWLTRTFGEWDSLDNLASWVISRQPGIHRYFRTLMRKIFIKCIVLLYASYTVEHNENFGGRMWSCHGKNVGL